MIPSKSKERRPRLPDHPSSRPVAKTAAPAVSKWWFALMALGGFGFGLIGERRPFGEDVLAQPLVVYFIVVGVALLVLRVVRARPVPEMIPERMLALGCVAGVAAFLIGNFVAVHLLASMR
jgi:hypothetical protein